MWSSRQAAFCAKLEEKLGYDEGERDMAVMHHHFGVEFDDGRPAETRTSTFIGYVSARSFLVALSAN